MPSTLPLAVLYHGTPWQAVALAEGSQGPADALRVFTQPGAHPLLLTAQAPSPNDGDHLTLQGQVLRHEQGEFLLVGTSPLLQLALHTRVPVTAPPDAWPQIQEALRTHPRAHALPHRQELLLSQRFSLTLGPDLHLILTALRTRQERQLARLLDGLQLLEVQSDPSQIGSQLDLVFR
ncbi:hypothetical protein [Deinococcus planocerae]|uniref:hypothetical protein n=1 Tax=Deinococcus planocerae TaxID=1737569 RepID=UPI0011AF5B72|nr:hypothetical protein [Deinococcus planocerae]